MGEILLVAADWQMRALVRAQLLEEGYEVRAWPALELAMAHLLAAGRSPRVTILDLAGIETEARMVSDLWELTGQAPLLVCAGMASRACRQPKSCGGPLAWRRWWRGCGECCKTAEHG